jgi:hypothetical protein
MAVVVVVVCCVLCVVCCLLFVVCCLVFGVWCLVFVVCCLFCERVRVRQMDDYSPVLAAAALSTRTEDHIHNVSVRLSSSSVSVRQFLIVNLSITHFDRFLPTFSPTFLTVAAPIAIGVFLERAAF